MATRNRIKHIGRLVVVLLTGTHVSAAIASEASDSSESVRARPYVATDRVVTLSGVSIPLYFASGSGQGSKIVVYEPPVMLKAKEIKGAGRKRLVPVSKLHNDGTLSIEIVWDVNGRAITAGKIAEQIANWQDAQFLGVEDGNINPLYAAKAWFEIEEVNGETTLSSMRAENFYSAGAVPVHFNFKTEEKAKRMADELENDFAPLRIRFRYAFDGALVESCVARAESGSLQNTWRYKNLVGDGAPAKVSRRLAVSAAKDVVREVDISTRCAANLESDRERLDDMLERRLNQIEAAAESLNDSWERLDKYGFDPRDVMSDVESLVKEEKESETKSLEKNTTDEDRETSGSWEVKSNWGDVGASISNSFKDKEDVLKEELRDRLARKGVKTEWQGERLIPKTVDVITNEQIRGVFDTDVIVSYERVVESSQTLKVDLDEHRMYVDDSESKASAVQPLSHQVAELSQRLSALEELNESTSVDVNELSGDIAALQEYVDSTKIATQKGKNTEAQLKAYLNRQWADVTDQRNLRTTYPNNTGLPIEIYVRLWIKETNAKFISDRCRVMFRVGRTEDSLPIATEWRDNGIIKENQRGLGVRNAERTCMGVVTVPPGSYYRVEGRRGGLAELLAWKELHPVDAQ